ncbi:DUF3613 domain-containing protein [Comamonas sp. J-3]|uniref:DUF3613 domain-containing protein n=1 Tax=Comamonas trifloxystrobinivorans TaxID=3350256 RepID=UPI003727F22A
MSATSSSLLQRSVFGLLLAAAALLAHAEQSAQTTATPASLHARAAPGTSADALPERVRPVIPAQEIAPGRPSAVGPATERLLDLQRNAQSERPRRIDGELASRSYQRYLKSFETAIPEQFDTGMNLKKQ